MEPTIGQAFVLVAPGNHPDRDIVVFIRESHGFVRVVRKTFSGFMYDYSLFNGKTYPNNSSIYEDKARMIWHWLVLGGYTRRT